MGYRPQILYENYTLLARCSFHPPRVYSFVDRLWQEPIPKLQTLCAKHYTRTDLPKENLLQDIKGDALELKATFSSGTAKRFGIKLRVSPDE